MKEIICPECEHELRWKDFYRDENNEVDNSDAEIYICDNQFCSFYKKEFYINKKFNLMKVG